MKLSVKVDGLKEIEAALAGIEKTATRKTVARNALKRAGAPIAEAMSAKAPRDKGDLAESVIVSTKIKGEAGKAAYAKTMRDTAGNRAAAVKSMREARRAAKGSMPPVVMFVGPTDMAAHLVEFGTAPHINGGRFAGSKHPGTVAQPFARPAWEENKDKALSMITESLRAEIMRAAARQAKRRAKNG